MRLIDADALKKKVRNECLMPYWCYVLIDVAISDMPTIEERKKGKWEWSKLPITGAVEQKCSICGTPFYMAFRLGMNYCPNCGADMRGEDDGKQPDLPEM